MNSTLSSLWGYTAAWQAAFAALGVPGVVARVVSAHRGAYRVVTHDGVVWAECLGRAYYDATDKRALPVVGDFCVLAGLPGDAGERAIITHVLPRENVVIRKAAGRRLEPQPMVANVALGVIVTSAGTDVSQARLDRYLTMLADAKVPALVVLSKADTLSEADREATVAALRATFELPVVALSSHTGLGLQALAAALAPGATGALLGSSGVGKSSLINALAGSEIAHTSPLARDERGVHTTTHRELVLTSYGLWIDSPGLREVGTWQAEPAPPQFADIDAWAAQCRFADCQHVAEPGCAVQAAIAAGQLAPARLASYTGLSTERQVSKVAQRVASRLALKRGKPRRA